MQELRKSIMNQTLYTLKINSHRASISTTRPHSNLTKDTQIKSYRFKFHRCDQTYLSSLYTLKASHSFSLDLNSVYTLSPVLNWPDFAGRFYLGLILSLEIRSLLVFDSFLVKPPQRKHQISNSAWVSSQWNVSLVLYKIYSFLDVQLIKNIALAVEFSSQEV